MPRKRSTAYRSVMAIIRKLTGEENLLAVPRLFIDYTGSLETAVFLARLLYWSDKGARKDGFIWKSNRQWQSETGLSGYAVRKASEWLQERHLIQVDLMQAQGAPTLHYRLDQDELVTALSDYVRQGEQQDPDPFVENDKSTGPPDENDESDLSKTTKQICRNRTNQYIDYQEKTGMKGTSTRNGTGQDPGWPPWAEILTALELQMTKATFDTLFRGSTAHREDGDGNGRIVVQVLAVHAPAIIDARQRPVVERTVERVSGQVMELEFIHKETQP